MRRTHRENHLIERIGWLRAAVLGANDGIISTASLILGVVSTAGTQHDALIAGVAGLAAGAMAWRRVSMFPSAHSRIQNMRTSPARPRS